jgi:hypothetical protein
MTSMRPTPHDMGERIFIVPRAHTAIFETRFQLEMYVLFHRSPVAWIGHVVGTPTILLGAFVALQALGGATWPALALLAVVTLLGIRIDALAGAITGVLGLALVGLAAWLGAATGSNGTLVGLALVGVGGAIQTFSHAFEDVPPPHSGTDVFVPMRDWKRRIDLRELVRSTALTLGVFFWLELWATPRIWAIQVLQALMAAGWKPELRAALKERTREILVDPTSDWRRPRPRDQMLQKAS